MTTPQNNIPAMVVEFNIHLFINNILTVYYCFGTNNYLSLLEQLWQRLQYIKAALLNVYPSGLISGSIFRLQI